VTVYSFLFSSTKKSFSQQIIQNRDKCHIYNKE